MLDTSDQIQPLLEDPYAVPLEQLDPSLGELFLRQKHHAVFKRLRREDPVHLTPDSPFGPFWSITKFDDIVAVDSDHKRFSSEPVIMSATARTSSRRQCSSPWIRRGTVLSAKRLRAR